MRKRTKTALQGSVLMFAIAICSGLPTNLGFVVEKEIHAQTPERVAPPDESRYAGLTKCAACHYKQYEDWKTTPHAKTFDYLPKKYRNNAECLQCHTSRHGSASVGQALAGDLQGVGCEDCHGPGREHTNLALTFLGQDKELTDEAVEMLRSRIERISLGQCIKCHVTKAHQPHPKFDREKPAEGRQQLNAPRRRGFFSVHE